MTERFSKEWIAKWRNEIAYIVANPSGKQMFVDVFSGSLDKIEKLQQRVQELENEKLGILSVLGDVVSEAYLQDPFGDDAGMALLHAARTLLETYGSKQHENINSNKII